MRSLGASLNLRTRPSGAPRNVLAYPSLELGVRLGHYGPTKMHTQQPELGNNLLRQAESIGAAIGDLLKSSRMSISVARDIETPRPSHAGRAEKIAMVAAKLLVTAVCFWYVSRQIDWHQAASVVPLLDFRWVLFAMSAAMLQIPLLGLRWRTILQGVAVADAQMTPGVMIAATAVGVFFGQVMPTLASRGGDARVVSDSTWL
jgi:Lysylphosphatidylglycerol synthase TM region